MTGRAVFFTGLASAGKSTLAAALAELLPPPVSLLDGDDLKHTLWRELGPSRDHRILKTLRLGIIAAEVVRHGGTALCVSIDPYEEGRRGARRLVEQAGGIFTLVWVSTPLAVCEGRDHRYQYAKARSGEVTRFTGISDPYEKPKDADFTIDTTDLSAQRSADLLFRHLSFQAEARASAL